YGHDAGAADAGDQDAVGLGRRRHRRIGQRNVVERIGALRLAQAAALDGDEARTKAVDAGEILVARTLIDHALAAELGLHGGDRNAVRLDAAIAAAGYLPRLRRRRFSAAQVWSYSRTVQPGVSRSSRCTLSRSSR